MNTTIYPYQEAWREQVLDVWEQSVKATHHFLLPEDIDFYKALVKEIDFNAFEVYCAFNEEGSMVGILGVAYGKLEMLFLNPQAIGKGIGARLMEFALHYLNVSKVDVNEQNLHAVNFYKKYGFEVYERTALDDSGKPYPILKMNR